jgi:hypothetical protein
MPSNLHQKIFVGGIPDGVKMTIEEITPSIPQDGEEWFAGFTAPGTMGSDTVWGTVLLNISLLRLVLTRLGVM